MTNTTVGVVSSLRRYPVKSVLGEEITTASIVARGVDGDRVYALIDDETGKVISVKRPRRWGRIFEIAATTGADGVRVQLPDAPSMSIDDPELPGRLSDFFGRKVSVASVPPENASFDEAWVRELKNGVDPYFELPSRTEDGDELIDAGQLMGPLGNFFNFGAIHIVTTSTTRRLTELAPESRFDAHRFRPNIVVETDDDGFVETGWQGRTLTIGDARFGVSFTVPRCVMTTLEQGDLPADPNVLRTISQHNSVDMGGTGAYPCVGVYAGVVTDGEIHVGQPVTIE
jgi:uncharacterized protein YcbX